MLCGLPPTALTKTVFIITFAKAYRVRLMTKAHYLENTTPLFSQLDIFSINSFSVATFM